MGMRLIKSWSRTQATVATSSGEAELYATVKGATEFLGIQWLARDWGRQMSVQLRVDAKATIGTVHKSGLGKMRYAEVGRLWIQQVVRTK